MTSSQDPHTNQLETSAHRRSPRALQRVQRVRSCSPVCPTQSVAGGGRGPECHLIEASLTTWDFSGVCWCRAAPSTDNTAPGERGLGGSPGNQGSERPRPFVRGALAPAS